MPFNKVGKRWVQPLELLTWQKVTLHADRAQDSLMSITDKGMRPHLCGSIRRGLPLKMPMRIGGPAIIFWPSES